MSNHVVIKNYARWQRLFRRGLLVCVGGSSLTTYIGVSISKEPLIAVVITVVGILVQTLFWNFAFENVPKGFRSEESNALLRVVAFVCALSILGTTTWFSLTGLAVPDSQRVHWTRTTDEMAIVLDGLTEQRLSELELRKSIRQGEKEIARLAEAERRGIGGLSGLSGYRSTGPVHGSLLAMKGAYGDALGILDEDERRIEDAGLEAKNALSDMRTLVQDSYVLGDSQIGETNRQFAVLLATLNEQLAILKQSSVPTVLETVRGADGVAQHISVKSRSHRITKAQEGAKVSLLKISAATRKRVESQARRLNRRPISFTPRRTLMPLEAVARYWPHVTPWVALPVLTDLIIPSASLACLMLLYRRRQEEEEVAAEGQQGGRSTALRQVATRSPSVGTPGEAKLTALLSRLKDAG